MTAATTAKRRRWVGRIIPNLVLLVSAVFFIAPLLTLTRYALQNVPTVLLSFVMLGGVMAAKRLF